MRVRWNWLPATQLPSPLSNRSFTDAEIDDVIKKLELYRNRTEARKRAVTFYTGT